MNRYDTVVFDLDGTLLNTLDDLADAVNYVMRMNHYPERTVDEVRRFVGKGIRRLMELATPESVTGEAFESVFEEFKNYYTEHCQIKTCAYEGIMSLLERLYALEYEMAIVSNKNHAAVCELNEIYFKKYIKVAIEQQDGIQKKPAPDTVLQALKELGKEKDTAIYVGDSEVDFLTAQNTGIDCALVTWGFRTREELSEFTPTAWADHPEQLFEVLEK